MVADAIQRLGAQVERRQDNICAPGGVVVPLCEERAERLLTRVTPRAVPAVMAEGHCFGEGDVQSGGARDGGCDLSYLEGMGEAGALVVLWEDEDLRLTGEAPERARMQDTVAVALEASPQRVRFLLTGAQAGASGEGRARRQIGRLCLLPCLAANQGSGGPPALTCSVRENHPATDPRSGHGCGP